MPFGVEYCEALTWNMQMKKLQVFDTYSFLCLFFSSFGFTGVGAEVPEPVSFNSLISNYLLRKNSWKTNLGYF